ncbi:MAG: hypothetical protein R6W31_03975 [Bacteroidales bacterium]
MKSTPLVLLPSRLILFLVFQVIIALLAGSFVESQKYWLLSASATNIVSILILVILFKSEGKNFFQMFRFNRARFIKDIPLFLGLTVLCGPVVFLPNYFLSIWLWGDVSIPFNMMFQPINLPLVYILLFVFPVTIAFAELATYFVYIMPRLREHFSKKWISVALPVLFLSIQHCTLPFIPDFSFIAYRGFMYLPFACVIGIALYFRPTLFPYFAVLHGILDFGTVMVLLSNAGN